VLHEHVCRGDVGGAPEVTKATPITMVQQSLEAARLNDSIVAVATTSDAAGEYGRVRLLTE